MLSAVVQSAVMMIAAMLSVVMLNAARLSAVVLSLVARLTQSGTDLSGAPYWTPLAPKYLTRGE
jgi:hypothetical protein